MGSGNQDTAGRTHCGGDRYQMVKEMHKLPKRKPADETKKSDLN